MKERQKEQKREKSVCFLTMTRRNWKCDTTSLFCQWVAPHAKVGVEQGERKQCLSNHLTSLKQIPPMVKCFSLIHRSIYHSSLYETALALTYRLNLTAWLILNKLTAVWILIVGMWEIRPWNQSHLKPAEPNFGGSACLRRKSEF